MQVKDVYAFLDGLAPFSYAMDFDNCGILVGDPEQTVRKILVTLDCSLPAIEAARACGADLIVSHHPVIFSPLKRVTAGSAVYELLTSRMAVISAHTNLDLARGGVNDHLAAALGLCCLEGLEPTACVGKDEQPVTEYLGRVSFLKEPLSPAGFAAFVKEKLGGVVRYAAGNRPVHRVAVCGGSGADCLEAAVKTGADALVTSEVKHHIFLLAQQLGITLVDAGHFHTEDVVVEPLAEQLRFAFRDIPVETYHLDVIQTL